MHHHICTPKGVPVLRAYTAFVLNSVEADWKEMDKGLNKRLPDILVNSICCSYMSLVLTTKADAIFNMKLK